MENKFYPECSKEHENLLVPLFSECENICSVLDAGSGRTSMSLILSYFKEAAVTGVVFPGDDRKLNPLTSFKADNLKLVETDLVKNELSCDYDLVVCHLLFGEALMWGNSLENLVNSITRLKAKNVIVCDIVEDPSVDKDIIVKSFEKSGYSVKENIVVQKESPQQFKNFTSKSYFGVLFSL